MTGRSALLWMTHLWDRELEAEFESILNNSDPDSPEVWLMPDSRTPGAEDLARRYPRCHTIVEKDLFRSLPYTHPEGAALYDYVHYPLLHFFLSHPEFEYYWVIEFDVRFTGDWGSFLHTCGTYSHDLVTCHIRGADEEPLWWLWDTLRHPTKTIDRSGCLRSFNVIYRISNRALSLVHAALSDGWQGHPEVLIPTLLKNGGCTLLDFGGDGDYTPAGMKNAWYTSGSTRLGALSPFCTLRFRPSRGRAGIRRNKIYHPVKPVAAREPLRERIWYFREWTGRYIREILSGRHREKKACGTRNAGNWPDR